jgi:hypothetical protein
MADDKLSIILEKRLDDNKNAYYIGKLKAPVLIDAKDGICFLIFTAIEGDEEMQIKSILPPKREYNDKR